MQAYLINLDRNPDRLNRAMENFQRIGLDFIRYPAVDGAQLTQDDINAFALNRPHHTWSRGQIGCFLSHFRLWEMAARSEHEYVAIFEDDLQVSPSLKYFLQETNWIAKNIDIVRLEVSTNRVLFSKQTLGDFHGRHILEVLSTTWCAGGYVLSRKAAIHLLAHPISSHLPTDYFLFSFEDSPIAASLKIAQVFPALVIQDKFHQPGLRVAESSSNISDAIEGNSLLARLKYSLKVSPLEVLRRSIKGYKRVSFML